MVEVSKCSVLRLHLSNSPNNTMQRRHLGLQTETPCWRGEERSRWRRERMEAAENWCPPSSVSINRRRTKRRTREARTRGWRQLLRLSSSPPPIYLSPQSCVRALLHEIFLLRVGKIFSWRRVTKKRQRHKCPAVINQSISAAAETERDIKLVSSATLPFLRH